MSRTASIIRTEHRRLAALLNCLVGVLDDVESRHIEPDFDLFASVIDYLESFLYRFHHPKEDDHLFPALLARSPEAAAVIERLEAQHARGPELLAQLRQALAAYRDTGAAGHAAFRDAVTAYRQFEWDHMGTEEREVLPLADRVLTTADWQALDAQFTAHDDPLFGDRPRAEFASLLSSIVSRAPAPHGLAEPHAAADKPR